MTRRNPRWMACSVRLVLVLSSCEPQFVRILDLSLEHRFEDGGLLRDTLPSQLHMVTKQGRDSVFDSAVWQQAGGAAGSTWNEWLSLLDDIIIARRSGGTRSLVFWLWCSASLFRRFGEEGNHEISLIFKLGPFS